MERKKRNVIIDTDAGADDLLALILACRSNRLNIEAVVTSYGNFYEHDAFSRVQATLRYLGADRDIPIIRGSRKPIARDFSKGPAIHGTFSAGTHKSKEFFEKRFLDEIHPYLTVDQKVTYIALGPLTNCHRVCALMRTTHIEKVVVMGGTFTQSGNVTREAEANFFWDPEAVQSVFSTGFPIDLIPLDVTEHIQLDEGTRRKLKDSDFVDHFFMPYSEYYVKKKKQYFDIKEHKRVRYRGGALHDVVTLLSVIDPSILFFRNMYLGTDKVTTARRGYVYEKYQLKNLVNINSSIRIAKEIDEERFWKVFNTVLTHPRGQKTA